MRYQIKNTDIIYELDTAHKIKVAVLLSIQAYLDRRNVGSLHLNDILKRRLRHDGEPINEYLDDPFQNDRIIITAANLKMVHDSLVNASNLKNKQLNNIQGLLNLLINLVNSSFGEIALAIQPYLNRVAPKVFLRKASVLRQEFIWLLGEPVDEIVGTSRNENAQHPLQVELQRLQLAYAGLQTDRQNLENQQRDVLHGMHLEQDRLQRENSALRGDLNNYRGLYEGANARADELQRQNEEFMGQLRENNHNLSQASKRMSELEFENKDQSSQIQDQNQQIKGLKEQNQQLTTKVDNLEEEMKKFRAFMEQQRQQEEQKKQKQKKQQNNQREESEGQYEYQNSYSR